MNRLLQGGLAVGLLAIGGVAIAIQDNATKPVSTQAPPEPAATPSASASAAAHPSTAHKATPTEPEFTSKETPMAQRVAVIGLLNKRNGISRDLTMKPGQAVRVGDVIVRLRACETTAPWEPEKLTGAFVQLDVQGTDHNWRRVFSGWLFKESPSLNVVEHPIYDVWPKSCAMTHPEIGPATVTAASLGAPPSGAVPAPASRSRAPKSAPSPTPSASPSNPT